MADQLARVILTHLIFGGLVLGFVLAVLAAAAITNRFTTPRDRPNERRPTADERWHQ